MDRNVIGDVMGKALAESLSARRAWIEIPSIHLLTDRFFVALRKESVDRNVIGDVMGKALAVALRKESVDRNFQTTTLNRYDIVALRKESVDRNSIHPFAN